MKSKITGTTMPVLEVGLEPGDVIIAEPGEFSWMTGNVQLNTTTQTAGALYSVMNRPPPPKARPSAPRKLRAPAGSGVVGFAAKLPGGIVELSVQPGSTYMIHRHGFVCATQGVELSTGCQRSLGAGLFGGEGFVLQRLSGSCTAWVELGGEIVTYDLQ